MDAKKIGCFIAEKRQTKKMTQVQMGEALGVTAKTISRWENGNYMPDIALLIPLAELLDVSVNELLNGESSIVNATEEPPLEVTIAYTKKRESLLAQKYIVNFVVTAIAVVMIIWLFHALLFTKLGASEIILQTNVLFMNGGVTMTNEMQKVVIALITVMIIGLCILCFSFWFLWLLA